IGATMQSASIGYDALPLVFLAGGIGALACSFSAGRIADRLGNRTAGTMAGLAVIVVLAAFAVLPHLPDDTALPAILLIVAAQGYTVWAYAIAVASQMAQLAPSSVPVAI